MRTPKDSSALSEAAAALEHELVRFERAAEAARGQRLDSARNLERGAKALARAAEIEAQLGARVSALIAAIQAADARQKGVVQALQAFGAEIQARQESWRAVTSAFEALGRDVIGVKAALESGPDALEAAHARIEELDAQAAALVADVDAAGFQDLSADARALQQQLRALLAAFRRGR